MSIDISHETEARLTDEARRRGISVEALLERLMTERGVTAHLARHAPELPVCHLEVVGLSTGRTSSTMSIDAGIIDTNVLVHAMDADAPQHAVWPRKFYIELSV